MAQALLPTLALDTASRLQTGVETSLAPCSIYFDTESHIIRYNLTFPSANKAIFESDATQSWTSKKD